jgi:23S rRNA (cytidine1920-2'-O)/16S rRNA (cytidine1409-2'-O)-methyltransferase
LGDYTPVKKRIDLILVDRGLVPSCERAQALLISGNVLVNDTPITKPGAMVPTGVEIRIRGEDHPYVSRGGVKLAAALDAFGFLVQDRVALDVGASTGGFTHVLLLRGVAKVFAVDVGHNQLDWRIRQDLRVVTFEKVNARHMEFGLIGQRVDVIVVDVSFISLAKILPALVQFATNETDWVTLIKPQFEVGKNKVGKGGIVTSEDDRQAAIRDLTQAAEVNGLRRLSLIESPITGTRGNKEYLAHWKLQGRD